jgi:hypothetical protein
MPYAIVGIILLGLVVSSIRNIVIERNRARKRIVAALERKRKKYTHDFSGRYSSGLLHTDEDERTAAGKGPLHANANRPNRETKEETSEGRQAKSMVFVDGCYGCVFRIAMSSSRLVNPRYSGLRVPPFSVNSKAGVTLMECISA